MNRAPHAVSRRSLLAGAANGFAMLPLRSLLAGGPDLPHHPPRAKAVIFLYMDGGPSAQDLFDHKPLLQQLDGEPFPARMEPTQFNDNGRTLGPIDINTPSRARRLSSDVKYRSSLSRSLELPLNVASAARTSSRAKSKSIERSWPEPAPPAMEPKMVSKRWAWLLGSPGTPHGSYGSGPPSPMGM